MHHFQVNASSPECLIRLSARSRFEFSSHSRCGRFTVASRRAIERAPLPGSPANPNPEEKWRTTVTRDRASVGLYMLRRPVRLRPVRGNGPGLPPVEALNNTLGEPPGRAELERVLRLPSWETPMHSECPRETSNSTRAGRVAPRSLATRANRTRRALPRERKDSGATVRMDQDFPRRR